MAVCILVAKKFKLRVGLGYRLDHKLFFGPPGTYKIKEHTLSF